VVLPLGIAQYVDVSLLFEGARAHWNAGLIAVLALLGFFRVWRWAYLGALLLLHVQYAARYTLGEIPHSANLAGMALLALALAVPAFRTPGRQRRFTLGFTYLFVGLGYTVSGFCKLVGTGIGWPDGHHLWMWINEKKHRQLCQVRRAGPQRPPGAGPEPLLDRHGLSGGGPFACQWGWR
jgi:hypothetical protein